MSTRTEQITHDVVRHYCDRCENYIDHSPHICEICRRECCTECAEFNNLVPRADFPCDVPVWGGIWVCKPCAAAGDEFAGQLKVKGQAVADEMTEILNSWREKAQCRTTQRI